VTDDPFSTLFLVLLHQLRCLGVTLVGQRLCDIGLHGLHHPMRSVALLLFIRRISTATCAHGDAPCRRGVARDVTTGSAGHDTDRRHVARATSCNPERRVSKGCTRVNYAFAQQQHMRHPPYEEEKTIQ